MPRTCVVKVPLIGGKGLMALVDAKDCSRVVRFSWFFVPNRWAIGYACRRVCLGGKKYATIYMHDQFIPHLSVYEIDHKNHNGLDNRRANLRVGTRPQNRANMRKRPGCTSRYKGVYFYRKYGNWRAEICIDGKRRFLGYFEDEIEAAQVYDRAAFAAWGEFARLNLPNEVREVASEPD